MRRNKRWRWTLATAGIVAGLAVAVRAIGACPCVGDSPAHEPVGSNPTNVRGARLDAIDPKPPVARGTLDAVGSKPNRTPRVIPDSSFERAAKLDGVAKPENGTLRFELTKDGKHLKVPMSALASFPYEPQPHPPGADLLGIPAPSTVPKEILALDGKEAVLVGFMVPLDTDRKGVKAFVLSQNRSFCCYGIPPALNEMVLIQMDDGDRAPFLKDIPLSVFGKLTVREQREGGRVVSLYRMQASKVSSISAIAQSP